MRPSAPWMLIACFSSGCASIAPEKGHAEVSTLVEQRTGHSTGWQRGGPEATAIAVRVDQLLAGGLSKEHAIELALLNNPTLQSTYEELGISQADMVQAGLLKNPSVGAHVGFPLSANTLSEVQFSLVQDLLDLLILPLRKSIAADQFAADVQRVAGRALEVVAEVKKAFVGYQAAQRAVQMQQTIVDTAQATAELSQKQFEAGNVAELTLVAQQAGYEEARLEVAKAQIELEMKRKELNSLLGLWGPRADWKLTTDLEDPPAHESDLDDLEALAMRQRPDIEAARRQAALFQQAVDLARSSRAFGSIEVGADYHRDPDGPRVVGPSLRLELALFDQRQALIARLEAQQRQAEDRLSAEAVDARNGVRSARTRLLLSRLTVEHYQSRLLPLRDRAVELAQFHYNGMLIGLPGFLSIKRDQVEAHRAYLDAVREYWVARADLERLVGGRLEEKKSQ